MQSTRLRNLSWLLVASCAVASACDSNSSGLGSVHSAAHANFPGPQFPGSGNSGAGNALAAGAPVVSCDGTATLPAGTFGPGPSAQGTETCFFSDDDPVNPAATMEWIVETAPAGELVHVRLTLNPSFADNTYGEGAIGWLGRAMPGMPGKPGGKPGMPGGPAGHGGPAALGLGPAGPGAAGPGKAGHTFRDLVESDHAEFKLRDAAGALALSFDADYISLSPGAPSGYATLGVLGGEGRMLFGGAADVVAVSTSIDRDLNACGLGSYIVDSPATDQNYTPNTATPNWDYRVIYDVWVRRSAFGAAGFGSASVDFVHASPSKASSNTIVVHPGDCPPWPYCRDPRGCCMPEADGVTCTTTPPRQPANECDSAADCPYGI